MGLSRSSFGLDLRYSLEVAYPNCWIISNDGPNPLTRKQ